ncbi:MAG: hypothetical protein MZU95_07535, partial [Desulfomicrobium escambiense]|nr:hypothetical protein [Desulfomicrobium escambiense]
TSFGYVLPTELARAPTFLPAPGARRRRPDASSCTPPRGCCATPPRATRRTRAIGMANLGALANPE